MGRLLSISDLRVFDVPQNPANPAKSGVGSLTYIIKSRAKRMPRRKILLRSCL
jgi:hypothetical protein